MASANGVQESLLPPKASQRSQSPARSVQSADKPALGWRKLKKHMSVSSDTLVAPSPEVVSSTSGSGGSSVGKDGLRPPSATASPAGSPGKHCKLLFR